MAYIARDVTIERYALNDSKQIIAVTFTILDGLGDFTREEKRANVLQNSAFA